MTTEQPCWHTSNYSAGGQNCVEVREHDHGADLRDSQNRNAACLMFAAWEWAAFVADLRSERP
ncbi:DUF397 domain-containing protein [Allosalinactinospora lopnorensis]|uniref:DUF397 domain-containing protein n=1 Tax=Allosalinactinospora lopnorensis TaxID=1352348 RepID=UPI000623E151|nr:DUF397 domain-containing protein [Allosalinactinospora lopnorensis]